MRDRQYLFSDADWFSVEQNQLKKMQEEIAAVNGDRLLNTAVDDLARYFESKFKIEVPALVTEEIVVDQREAKIDVRHDPRRWIDDRSRPVYVPGTELEVEIPFTGDSEVFRVRPTSYTMSPPRAEVRSNALVLRISGTDLTADGVQQSINQTINEVQSHLSTLRTNTAGLNQQLFQGAKTSIESRRQKLLADRNLVGALGFKMKQRDGNQRTFSAPEVKRKIAPTMPPASSAPYKPEPVLNDDDYEHILSVLDNMAHVMERSPSAFHHMDEEALRTHFLVQLNGHYEGQATGETFNYEGKTDILVRSGDKNIFIAECKFWGGPKKLSETIDQLLGYSSWRDTKTAVIIFNRNRDFSRVLATIPEAAKQHPNFKRELAGRTDTRFRYCFSHRDDANRELLLAILVFDVPTPQ
ncbi:MAG: hypothetical protein NTW45_01600 [Rhodocyclales bacterium]|nr:hypothetical protein [Rhodocyclales bacterium]